MTRAALILMAAVATSAFGPMLSQARPGVWELRRVPDGKPVRQCIADVSALAQVEQRGEVCTRKLIDTDGASSVIRYTCPGGGFGQSKVTVVTPRSLTIETQGISGGLPFAYVVHARRLGDCGAP